MGNVFHLFCFYLRLDVYSRIYSTFYKQLNFLYVSIADGDKGNICIICKMHNDNPLFISTKGAGGIDYASTK